MKLTLAIPRRILMRPGRDEPDMFGRITAALAVLAWLVLASDALAQGTNQWAPQGGLQMPVAPDTGQVWSGDAAAGPVYAPIDLDQQLASGTLKAPLAAAPQSAPPQVPVYAPAGTATSRLAQPGAPVTVPAQPYGGVGMAPATAIAAQPYIAAPPYGQPYGQQPYGQAFPQPYTQPYPQPYAQPGYGYGYATPYSGAIPPGLYPGITPGIGGWNGPYGGPGLPGGYGGVPFFGASPFGFW